MNCRALILALLLSEACSHHQAPRRLSDRQASCATGAISDTAVSGLPIRAAVASVKQHCHVLRDTTFAGLEGLPERTLDVQIDNDTVVAEIDSDHVSRINIRSTRLRTRDSLGVGISLATLLQHGHAKALIGEGNLYVVLQSHCGLSFALPHLDLPASGDLDEARLRSIPDTLRVQEVLVVDCDSAQGAT